ncbi:histidine kinase [Thermomonas sp. LB-4]|uniref:sensor histidine kinase n=1 Tax=Thermomonas sp. LB-4 TaxID=3102790 RepID=UPI002ED89534
MTRDETRFLLRNALFGIGYAAFNLFFLSQFMPIGREAWLVALALGLGVWVASGALRIIATRRGWITLGGARFALRLLAGVVLGATFVLLLVDLVGGLARATGWIATPAQPPGWGMMVGYWFNIAIVLGLWAAMWASWSALSRYREGEIARLRAESQRSAMELEALRARLNPHFVFNALNNVRALINEQPARAREVVTHLSNILRHALEHTQRELTTLGEEMAVVEDYLAVEGVHYEDRLRVRRDVDPAALAAALPPMALQLLVENAIKHGIACTPGGGDLSLAARLSDGVLHLEVANPGRLQAGAQAGHGVGLAYLRTRLAREARHRFDLQQDGPRVVARLEIAQ